MGSSHARRTPPRLTSAATACVLALAAAAFVATPAAAASASFTNNTFASVDHTTVARTVEVTTADLPAGELISDVDITIDFHKASGSCATPGVGPAFNDELGFTLTSPGGTAVTLVYNYDARPPSATYSDNGNSPRVQVTFDDSAAQAVGANPMPTTGTFRPEQALSAFNGAAPQGTWTLSIIDDFNIDPVCFYGFTLDLQTGTLPVLTGGVLPSGLVGAAYSEQLPASTGGPITTYAASNLPAGLELNPSTGAITGTPTVSGLFTVLVTGTNGVGTSPAANFTIQIGAVPDLTGAPTATAVIGAPFGYTPVFTQGYPASTVTLASSSDDLPDGLSLNAVTGAIEGTPTGALGDFDIVLESDNGVGRAELPMTITVAPGQVASLEIVASAISVDVGGSLTFTVTAADIEGNPVDVTGEIELSSSVDTDVITGHQVVFPTASPHTITATHTPTSVTGSITVNVIPATPVPPARVETAAARWSTG